MIFSGCVYILMGTSLCKYGLNRSLGGARQNFCNETTCRLVQKVLYIQSNFVFDFLNNAITHQLVTMQGKVLKKSK